VAGREAAEEVWNLVKDTGGTGTLNFASPSNSPAAFTSSHPRGRGGEGNSGWAGGFDNSWGWGDKGNDLEGGKDSSLLSSPSVTNRSAFKAEGDDTVVDEDLGAMPDEDQDDTEKEDVAKQEWTLGSMLSMLGIPNKTLGWDDEEGEFVDA
jgi:hypothetical protein